MNSKVKAVIDRLEEMPKIGKSYDEKGRHGWRNPIRADTGFILQSLVFAKNPRNLLEIGTAHGLSACYLASALNPKARMTTIEWDEDTAKEAQDNFTEAELLIEVLSGDAMVIIPTLKGRPVFDCIFLDANKDGYLEQIKALDENQLLAFNCLILADNVIDRQKECQPFLDFMQRYPHTIVPTECGLLVGKLGADF
jgi:predicted O-methyltransferase YrrM